MSLSYGVLGAEKVMCLRKSTHGRNSAEGLLTGVRSNVIIRPTLGILTGADLLLGPTQLRSRANNGKTLRRPGTLLLLFLCP